MQEFVIPLDPVPASRPRVTRAGFSYYANPYKDFKSTLKALLPKVWKGSPIADHVYVTMVCFVPRPRTTKLSCPRPDVDNYAKAVLDGMNEIVLEDDRLVTRLTVSKAWAPPKESGYIHVCIESDPTLGSPK